MLPAGRVDFSAAGTSHIVGIDQLGVGGTVYRLAEKWSFPKKGELILLRCGLFVSQKVLFAVLHTDSKIRL